jgi:CHAT domain-containing protein/Tfp pilus assembly protein PilF
MMNVWRRLNMYPLAIFFGKQSVNTAQVVRKNIKKFEKRIQRSYLESIKYRYHALANLLIKEGRLSEAQQVLDMLKEVEFFEFIRRDHSSANILSSQVDYTPFEKRWLEKYNTVIEDFSRISSEYNNLEFKENKNETEKKRMEALDLELKETTKEYENFLFQAKDAFDKRDKEIKAGRIDPDNLANETSALQKTLKYLDETEGGKNAALHYLVYENRISAIITLPNSPPLLKEWEIDEKELNETVMNYISFILKSGEKIKGIHLVETSTKSEKKLYEETLNEMLRFEKKLYDFTFKPVDGELQRYGVTNLMISLDGVLRYIPLSALWDGKSYLLQRYRMTIITPSSLKNIKNEPLREKKILGLCASKGGQGFAPLYYARREIRSIVKDKEKGYNGLIEGKAFLDKDFTKESMVKELKKKHFPLVHISSHFKFSPGDETKNFLLLGDGNILKLSEIRRMEKLFENVNLLVLSACQTGIGGNGEEIDGFGELAQQSGAKSVIASLWSVADESTKELMVNFYRILKEGKVTNKIEVLRQAQLELAGLVDLLSKNKSQSFRQKIKYSHPYYWGAFIMMGNGRMVIDEEPVSQKLETESKNKNKILQAELWNNKGDVYFKKIDYPAAIECYRKAIKLNSNKVNYVTNLALTWMVLKKFTEGEGILKEALKKFKKESDVKKIKEILVDIYYSWAYYLSDKKEYKKAIEYYKKELAIKREIKDHSGEIDALNKIGFAYKALRQYKQAIEYFEKALTICREIKDRRWEGGCLNNIGMVFGELGQHDRALEYYEKALAIHREVKNRAWELNTLNNLGSVYKVLNQYEKAIKYYENELFIRKEIKDRSGEVKTFNKIGFAYKALRQNERAIEYFEKALAVCREIKDRPWEGGILYNIGMAFNELSKYDYAIKYYEQSLAIHREMKNRTWELNILKNLELVYEVLNQYEKAIKYYEKEVSIRKEIKDRSGEIDALNKVGFAYKALRQYKQAIEYFEKALAICREIKDRRWEGGCLNNIGMVFGELGQHDRALEYYEKALAIHREVKNRAWELNTLNNLGVIYNDFSQYNRAIEYFEKVLTINRELTSRDKEGRTLGKLGIAYYELSQYEKALECFLKALAIHNEMKDRSGEGNTLSDLMTVWETLKRYPLAIFYGKLSINIVQKTRKNLKESGKKLQRSYIETYKHRYRRLVNLLITEARLSEARQVLDMLKEAEFFKFIRRDSSSANNLSTPVDYTNFEKRWLENYNSSLEKLSKISSEYHELKQKKNKSDEEKKRMKELDLELEKAQKDYDVFLIQLKEGFDKHEKEIKEGKIAPDTLAKEASALQDTLKYLDENENGKHASLHFLVYSNRISVILTTPYSQSVKQTEIDEKEFNKMVMDYRNYIMKSGKETRDTQPFDASTGIIAKKNNYEKKLYDLIFKPVDEELKKYGATNLIVSLDGVLRYIPIAALWDGESYLVQRYRITVITPSSLKNIKIPPVQKEKILGLGASRGGHGFKRLPYVRKEIKAIVNDKEKRYNGLIQGKAFLDSDFTKDNFVDQLKSQEFPLVHISSHFKFSPGDETKNFLLLGDGNILKLSEIRRMKELFKNVNLLVLSACQTGVGGNGEEIDGFGELAQQSGAKSVVASLWPVADESTKYLMVAFYRNLKEGKVTSKIEALRQAQLELAGMEDLLEKDNRNVRKKTKYSHPYYWGAFIMMGNWR